MQLQWQGEDISDKTILIHTEQGHGDAIQFARFLPLVRERCKKIVLVCTEALRLLFKEMGCVDEVRLPGDLPKDLFDVYCPIMSLAAVLNIELDTLPSKTPYLTILKHVVVPKLTENGKPKIGLVWAGSATQQTNHHRSCPIEAIMKLTEVDHFDFYSFQTPLEQTHKEELRKHGVYDLEEELVSYSHTGALMQQMDLVISVCTSAVHLSGALNVRSLVLLSPYADWHWFECETQSSWYPNTRIIRQNKGENWGAMMDQIIGIINKGI